MEQDSWHVRWQTELGRLRVARPRTALDEGISRPGFVARVKRRSSSLISPRLRSVRPDNAWSGRLLSAGMGRTRLMTVIVQVLAVITSTAFVGLADTMQPAAASGDPWSVCTSGLNVSGSPQQPAPDGALLYAVSAPTATDAWAVGERDEIGLTIPLVEHWDGNSWSATSIDLSALEGQPVIYARLDAVVAFSPTDAWAGGTEELADTTYTTVLLHWNGSDWAVRGLPHPLGATGIVALGGTGGGDLWVGETTPGDGSLLMHSNGSIWGWQNSIVSIETLYTVAPNLVEVGGSYGDQGGIEETSPGAYLSLTTDPGTPDIMDLSGTGPDDLWAVGAPEQAGGTSELEHYNGSEWANIAPSTGGAVVTSDGVDKAQAVIDNPGRPQALQVSDPDGPTITSLSMTPLAWDPTWGQDADIAAISATPRGALFAVGFVGATGLTQRGIVFRDCAS